MVVVARMRLVFVVAVAVLVAFADATDPAGNWSRPTIEGLQHALIHSNYTLYRTVRPGITSYDWTATEGAEAAVFVRRNPNASAWDVLEFEYSAAMFPTDVEAGEGYYAAGYAEGWLTWDDMYSTFINQVSSRYAQLVSQPNATQFVHDHIEYMRRYPNDTAFGRQLRCQMRQIDGLFDGYARRFNDVRPVNSTWMSWLQVFLISYNSDLADVLSKFSPDPSRALRDNNQGLHCSALVRVTSDDLYVAHDTWNDYNTMLRQYKTYVFGGRRVSMSSYAGSISSTDDFYITGANLVATETTNGFYNASLCDHILPQQVSEFNRVMIANFLAVTPEQWFDLFATENSGTYNNQYMVANMAAAKTAIAAGQPLPTGTFYVGEQIPGLVVYADQTEHLNTHSYWASYNLPAYSEIYDRSDFASVNNGSFNFYNHSEYPRAKIFARMHSEVVDATTMWYLMRYNNWQHDPLAAIAWCAKNGGPYNCTVSQSSAFAVAARYDLGPVAADFEGTPFLASHVVRGGYGACDTKMTSATLTTANLTAYIINGPTNVQQPTFDFAAFIVANNYTEPRRGIPHLFNFAPLAVSTGWNP